MTLRVYVGGLRDVSNAPLKASGSECTTTQYSMSEERTQLRFLLPLVASTGKLLNRLSASMSCSCDLYQADSVSS